MKKKTKSRFLFRFVVSFDASFELWGRKTRANVSSASSTSIPAPEIADMTLDLLNPDNQVVPYGIYTNASLDHRGDETDRSAVLAWVPRLRRVISRN
jgi:hypothetical protein